MSDRRTGLWRGLAASLFHPTCWPRAARRVFVLTLPIALPLWMVAMLLFLVLACLRVLWEPLHAFWNAPRRRRYSYSHYSYHLRDGGVADLGRATRAEPAVDPALCTQAQFFMARVLDGRDAMAMPLHNGPPVRPRHIAGEAGISRPEDWDSLLPPLRFVHLVYSDGEGANGASVPPSACPQQGATGA